MSDERAARALSGMPRGPAIPGRRNRLVLPWWTGFVGKKTFQILTAPTGDVIFPLTPVRREFHLQEILNQECSPMNDAFSAK